MTTPYYTTVGPADPKAAGRAKVWASLAVITPLLAALATFGILSDDQANALNGAITAGIGLMTAFGFGFAAKKTNEQVHNGTFQAPPATNVFDQLGEIKTQVDATVDYAQTQAQQAVTAIQGATAMIPGGALVTGAVMSGPVGDLIQAMTDRQE